jgi:hypothetical protein
MVTAMRETLLSAGVEENNIRTDEFVGYMRCQVCGFPRNSGANYEGS